MLPQQRLACGVAVFVGALSCVSAACGAEPQPAELKPYTESVPGTDVSFDMVPVPAGTFTMGSPVTEKGRKADEGTQFEVEVEAFYVAKHEVSWPHYFRFARGYLEVAAAQADQRKEVPKDRFADAVTYPTPMHEMLTFPILDRRGGRGEGMPAVSMSQFAARQYTKWLSKKTGRFYRLPTEAEWEYACRAGTTTAYAFGDDPAALNDHGWYFDNTEEEQYQPVGTRRPNAWGIHDMHGNVAEWCVDAYAPEWYAKFTGKKVKAADAINWPTKRYPRVMRGGSYESEAAECRSAARKGSDRKMNIYDAVNLPNTPHWETAAYWVGFRVVSPGKEPPEAEKLRFWNADDDFNREVIRRDRDVHELIEPPAKP